MHSHYVVVYTVVMVTFSSSTFDGSESSGIVSATIIISGGVVSSKDINIPISFTPGTAAGMDDCIITAF